MEVKCVFIKFHALTFLTVLNLPLCSHFAFYDENEKVVPMSSQLVSTLFLPSTLIDHLCHISCVAKPGQSQIELMQS